MSWTTSPRNSAEEIGPLAENNSSTVNPFARSDPRFLLVFPAANNNETLFQRLNVLVGDRVLFKYNRRFHIVQQDGMDAAPSFPKDCDVLLGTLLDLFSPDNGTENSNSIISKLLDTNIIICLQEGHGKNEFL